MAGAPPMKEVPWCTVFLCTGALLFHTMVLLGNYQTATGIENLGKSVDGWSEVGLATGKALSTDLDPLLSNVTFQLTDAVEETIQAQEMIDTMLSLFAMTSSGAQNGLLLNRAGGDPTQAVMGALEQLPHFQNSLQQLQVMFETIKPALMQVAVFVETFSDKVQTTVEAFGTTIDRVQKIFDQAMAQVSGISGEGADQMEHDTFNLFDIDGSGKIGLEDLHNVATLYAIYAVDGDHGRELIEHYDVDGDGEIDEEEFPNMVEDSSVTGIMAVVLREYAKRLSKVAGNVGAARMRSEVSQNVVSYFQLVCSKNLTKVGWVSDMLTNGSLPMNFTADVMAELALMKDDPNLLTIVDVGQIVVGMMMQLNSDYTLQALELMSDPEYWESEGYDVDDLPSAVEAVTDWTTTGPDFVSSLEGVMETLKEESVAKGEKLPVVALTDMVTAMPAAAKKLSQARVSNHRKKRLRKRHQKRLKMFGKQEQQVFLVHLLHGVAATDGGAPDLALQALAAGVPARPETLEFAQWLKNNATTNSDLFVEQSFAYTGQSSSALDAFNTQIQGMVKKLSGLIDILKRYATPAAVDKLEVMVNEFASNGMTDVFSIVTKSITGNLGGTPQLLLQTDARMHSNASAKAFANSTDSPREVFDVRQASAFIAGTPSYPSYMGHHGRYKAVSAHKSSFHSSNDSSSSSSSSSRRRSSDSRRRSSSWSHSSSSSSQSSDSSNSNSTSDHVMLSTLRATSDQIPIDAISGVWDQVSTFLREVETVMPQAIDTLKFARKEVSSVAETLNSLFGSLKDKGPPIFQDAAKLYRLAWTLYFFFVVPLTLGILFYGFWASGYFGGPRPFKETTTEHYEEPQGVCARLCAVCTCCTSCCTRVRQLHDWHMCFWSIICLWQVIVLVMFVISLVFAILAGVQIFVAKGCAAIYILGDLKICTETLGVMSAFMSTFILGDGGTPLSMTCRHYSLMTCDVIQSHLVKAAAYTVVGSFVATFFSFQMVFDTAMLHERVRFRRLMFEVMEEKEGGTSSSA